MHLLAFVLLLTYGVIGESVLTTHYAWKYFDYEWRSPEQRQFYLNNKLYDRSSMIPIDVDRSAVGQIFVTIRGAPGVPASLNTLSLVKGKTEPLLKPYPDWSWYEMGAKRNCSHSIISVYRVAIDKCNRLWVLDNGFNGGKYECPAKILVFNLGTNRLIYQKVIPDNIAQNKSGMGLLVTPIVEFHGGNCNDFTLYMADVTGYGLVMWNGKKTVRLENQVFEPEERYINVSIADQKFQMIDGILGMALSPNIDPMGQKEERHLYFRSFSSLSMYGADTEVLRRSSNSANLQYFGSIDVLPSQATAQVFSSEGVLFYGLTEEPSIGCWNFRKPMTPRYFNIVLKDRKRLQFIGGMKVFKIYDKLYQKVDEHLLMLSNRYQKFSTKTIDFSEINFRILIAPVKNLIKGTVCDTQ